MRREKLWQAVTHVLVEAVRTEVGEEPRRDSCHICLCAALNVGKVGNVLIVCVKSTNEVLKGGLSGPNNIVDINTREQGGSSVRREVNGPAGVEL